ncbi:MAG TPA: hypothetical protein VGC49_01240 [Solirubrobacterales bacterium]|jgi:hypothetical protein
MRWRGRERAQPLPSGRFELAAARFNSSDAGRTVAGLVRSLGTPSVSVGAMAGSADRARVTVAWQLCWYQWGVDLGEQPGSVLELGKGSALSQLDSAARQWNASVAEGGRIVIRAPGRRRPTALVRR